MGVFLVNPHRQSARRAKPHDKFGHHHGPKATAANASAVLHPPAGRCVRRFPKYPRCCRNAVVPSRRAEFERDSAAGGAASCAARLAPDGYRRCPFARPRFNPCAVPAGISSRARLRSRKLCVGSEPPTRRGQALRKTSGEQRTVRRQRLACSCAATPLTTTSSADLTAR